MPRPARNDNSVVTRTGKQYITPLVPPGPTTVTTSSAYAYRWSRDISPAGVSVPFTDGLRVCAPWSRNGLQFARTDSDVVYEMRTNNSGGYRRMQHTDGSYWQSGVGPPEAVLPSANMINESVVKALNKLKRQDIHLGNFFVEADKTIEMVTGAVKTITYQVKRFRGSNPAFWRAVAKWETGNLKRSDWCKIPSSWLALQYGWLPLLSDVWGGIHHLTALSREDVPLISVDAYVKDRVEVQTFPVSINGGSKATTTWECKRKTSCALTYVPENWDLAELSSLGLANPLEWAWERMPYSFVVDWFLPIGNWLGALTGDLGFTFFTGSQSSKVEMRPKSSRVTSYAQFFGQEVRGNIPAPEYKGFGRKFVRTCYASTPVPGVYIKNPLSAVHLANAMSLLVQAFSGTEIGRRKIF